MAIASPGIASPSSQPGHPARGAARPAIATLGWFIDPVLIAHLARMFEQQVGPLQTLLDACEVTISRADVIAGHLPAAGNPASDAAYGKLHRALVGTLARQLSIDEGREPLRPIDWKLFLYVIASARTLRYAIERAADLLLAIDGRMGRFMLRVDRGEAQLAIDSGRSQRTLPACAVDLCGVVQLHGLFSALIDAQIPVQTIGLDYSPAHLAGLVDLDVLPALQLDRGWTGFAFPAVYLDHPVLRTEEALGDWASSSFIAGAGAAGASEPLGERVRNFLLHSLRNVQRLPAFEDVVAHFAMNSATVRRRLAREGTSYRKIKDSCRLELALEMLQRSHYGIEDISVRLDFCDSDAFRMAFHKWMGIAPTTYRQSLLSDRKRLPPDARQARGARN